ncbi:MAG: response regulator [Betaproteobacteria bacterium]|nr:response regulator [Betaproteobacteria bacterium]
MKLIAIVEDEPKIAALLTDYLVREGFATRHHAEGLGVVEAVRREPPDLLILDIMLPGKDGLAIAREIRAFSDLPIILLTARVEEIDRLLGLEIGADDYICKPFSPREVVARAKAILRRTARTAGLAPAQPDPIHLDEARYAVEVRGTPVTLTPVEFRLLATLMGRPGQVLSRTQLMDSLYLDHRVVSDRTVDSHVKNLRKKLVDAGGDEEWLRSIYGVGYKIDW